MIHNIPPTAVGPLLRIVQKLVDLFRGKVEAIPPAFSFFYATIGTVRRAVIRMETNLQSTVDKGWQVESMSLLVSRGESSVQSFSQWLYEENGELCASGFSIPKSGRRLCAYFLLPEAEQDYRFVQGTYSIALQIACARRGERMIRLSVLEVDKHLSEAVRTDETGIELTWQKVLRKYVGMRCQVKTYCELLARRY